MRVDISERAQSAKNEGRQGHSGMLMCSEYLSNHPASWISKQEECWAAFNLPLLAKRKRPQRSSSFFFLICPDRDENKHSQKVANKAEGSIDILVDLVWAACIKSVRSYTDMITCHQECIYLFVSGFACGSVYQWIHMLIWSVQKYIMCLCIVKNWKWKWN